MRILIKGTNWIGDAVMSIPAVRRIRSAFPEAFIALHTRKWAEGVFQDSGLFDEIVSYEPSRTRFRTVLEQAGNIRSRSFDVAVILPNSFESALTVALASVPRRIGYRTEGRGFLLTESVPVPEWKGERHESQFYLNLADLVIDTLGGEKPGNNEASSLSVSNARKQAAFERLRTLGINNEDKIIAIGAGSTNSMAKRWPAEYFARLCDSLSEDLGAKIVLLGARNEADVGEVLRNNAEVEVHDLTGATDLAMATAILSIVDLFVSNDMGLAHIAAGLGVPTLTIFGPTNETTTMPLGPKARFIREVVDCSPCMLRECPIDHRCMTRVTPDRVFRAASELLHERLS